MNRPNRVSCQRRTLQQYVSNKVKLLCVVNILDLAMNTNNRSSKTQTRYTYYDTPARSSPSRSYLSEPRTKRTTASSTEQNTGRETPHTGMMEGSVSQENKKKSGMAILNFKCTRHTETNGTNFGHTNVT